MSIVKLSKHNWVSKIKLNEIVFEQCKNQNHHHMKTYSFEKLDVWQETRQLTVKIYKITRDFPDDEKFGLISQMRRAGISISSNIAEGSSRYSGKDQIRFYEIAYGSLMELLNQLILSCDLMFLREEYLLSIREDIDSISYKLTRLSDSNRNKTEWMFSLEEEFHYPNVFSDARLRRHLFSKKHIRYFLSRGFRKKLNFLNYWHRRCQ